MATAWDNDKLIRVNMTDQTISVEDFPSEWRLSGGRALSAKILLKECDPGCDVLAQRPPDCKASGTLPERYLLTADQVH